MELNLQRTETGNFRLEIWDRIYNRPRSYISRHHYSSDERETFALANFNNPAVKLLGACEGDVICVETEQKNFQCFVVSVF